MTTRFVLLLAIATVFWPALCGTYVCDDKILVASSHALRNSDFAVMLTQPLFGGADGYWRPLSRFCMWLGHGCCGPLGIHLLALSLHAANTLTVRALALRLLGDDGRAFWVAMLFALHPLQVESVVWCSAISEPVWAACALQGTMAALRWRDRGAAGAPCAAAAWCLAALLAKESAACSLPLVVATLLWVPWPGPEAPRTVPWRRVAFALAGSLCAWCSMRALALGELPGAILLGSEVRPLDTLRVLTAPLDLLVRHLCLLLQPFPMTPFRAFPEQVSVVRATALFAGFAAVVAGSRYGWRRIAAPARFAGGLLLLPLLPPVLCFRSIGSYPLADRYLYVAVFGFALLVSRAASWPRLRWLPQIIVLACAPVSFAQTWVWQDQQCFVEHALAVAPDDPKVAVMAGDLALERVVAGDVGALPTARHHYLAAAAAVRLPHAGCASPVLSAARLGLAWCMLLEQQGRRGPGTGALLAAFQTAVDSEPQNPAAWVGLGVGNGIAERYDEAERALHRALDLDADQAEAWFNLGLLQVRTNRRQEATTSLQQALRCRPDNATARQLLEQLR